MSDGDALPRDERSKPKVYTKVLTTCKLIVNMLVRETSRAAELWWLGREVNQQET